MADSDPNSPSQPGMRDMLRMMGAAGIDDDRGLGIGHTVIDTRLESTFDIIRQTTLRANTPNIFGPSDGVKALVLRSEDAPLLPWGRPAENMQARCRIIDNYHSEILPDPDSIDGQNPLDNAIISSMPVFRYSAMDQAGVLPPGTIIRGIFDAGSLRAGSVAGILMPPGGSFMAMGGSGSMGPMGGNMSMFRMMGGSGGPYTKGVDMYDYKQRLVPKDLEGCQRFDETKCRPKTGVLNEEIVVSTVVPNAYGGYARLKVSVLKKLEKAYLNLQAQGINLSVGDTLRSFEGQRKAYMTKGQPGQEKWDSRKKRPKVAHPCSGFHTEGQAVDIDQKHKADILAHGPIYQALWDVGLQRINWEFWHWSVGETSRKPRDKVFAAGCRSSPADTFTGTPAATPSAPG